MFLSSLPRVNKSRIPSRSACEEQKFRPLLMEDRCIAPMYESVSTVCHSLVQGRIARRIQCELSRNQVSGSCNLANNVWCTDECKCFPVFSQETVELENLAANFLLRVV